MKFSITAFLLLAAACVSAGQDTTIQMVCRKLSSGEALNSDETLVNGMACRQARQSAPKTPNSEKPTAWFPEKKESVNPPKSEPVVEEKKDVVVHGPADNRQCLILKRMGPADQITSHMYSFGIRGKQFQYVEGDFPAGSKFHGRLTDHDIRDIQGHNGRVVIMEPKYSAEDLREAKQSCRQQ